MCEIRLELAFGASSRRKHWHKPCCLRLARVSERQSGRERLCRHPGNFEDSDWWFIRMRDSARSEEAHEYLPA